jgi:hypothetical protein
MVDIVMESSLVLWKPADLVDERLSDDTEIIGETDPVIQNEKPAFKGF